MSSSPMDDRPPRRERESQIHTAMDAACGALVALDRLSSIPEMHRFPGLEAEVDQAREALREAVRELRLARIGKPSTQELDFVFGRRGARSSDPQ